MMSPKEYIFYILLRSCWLKSLVTINPPESTLHCGLRLTETGVAAQGRRALFFLRRKRRQGLCLSTCTSLIPLLSTCLSWILSTLPCPAPHLSPVFESRTGVHPSPTSIMRPMRSLRENMPEHSPCFFFEHSPVKGNSALNVHRLQCKRRRASVNPGYIQRWQLKHSGVFTFILWQNYLSDLIAWEFTWKLIAWNAIVCICGNQWENM